MNPEERPAAPAPLPHGWYTNREGQVAWWDGSQWTLREPHSPTPLQPPPSSASTPGPLQTALPCRCNALRSKRPARSRRSRATDGSDGTASSGAPSSRRQSGPSLGEEDSPTADRERGPVRCRAPDRHRYDRSDSGEAQICGVRTRKPRRPLPVVRSRRPQLLTRGMRRLPPPRCGHNL